MFKAITRAFPSITRRALIGPAECGLRIQTLVYLRILVEASSHAYGIH